jgi:regulator of sigma E protease
MGLVPLSEVSYVFDSSPNSHILQQGDVITRVASLEAPRMGQLRNYLARQPDGSIDIEVLRHDETLSLQVELSDGKLGVLLINALSTPITAQPLEEVLTEIDGKLVPTPTAIAGKQILGGSKLFAVYGSLFDGVPSNNIKNWMQLRFQIGLVSGSHVPRGNLMLAVQNPTPNAELHLVEFNTPYIPLKHGWATPLSQQLFEPLYVTRSSGGNPFTALQMGFDETINMVVMTYLTIDRLIRRTVGVDQLRGPVGIIHIGSKIADRGMSYLLFFLAIISVNLAVLNFLPLPIVDGGLFLYLIYEKLFKKPPSLAFQNAAAMLGLALIATLFIVTFYNDIARLV